MKLLPIFLLAMLLAGCGQSAESEKEAEADDQKQEYNYYPDRFGEVSDFEDVLDSESEKQLTNRLEKVEESTSYDIAIATVSRLPEDMGIVNYANELGNRWKLGTAEDGNGVIIVFSESLGSVAIAPGKGVQGVVSDAEIRRIIDERMIPYFSMSDYYRGLVNALGEIENLAAQKQMESENGSSPHSLP